MGPLGFTEGQERLIDRELNQPVGGWLLQASIADPWSVDVKLTGEYKGPLHSTQHKTPPPRIRSDHTNLNTPLGLYIWTWM
jgi:hypothetical protein